MLYVLIIYIVGTLTLAIRLGWYAGRHLDRYDWHYARGEVIQSLLVAPLLWPLMLLVPRHLLRILQAPAYQFEKNESLFNVGFANAKFWREWNDLEINPPPCGLYIRYRPSQTYTGDIGGVFTMSADAAQAAIWQELDERYALPGPIDTWFDIPAVGGEERTRHINERNLLEIEGVEGAVLRWLARRDDSQMEPTDVPANWDIDYIAEKLARTGQASVDCLQCQRTLAPHEVTEHDDRGKRGWNYNYTQCPQGHNLLVRENMHLYFGRTDAK